MKWDDVKVMIETAFETQGHVDKQSIQETVNGIFSLLNEGKLRVAERQQNGEWHVNEWIKKAILLHFGFCDLTLINGAPGHAHWWDKVPSKFSRMDENAFREANFRAVPGCVVRYGSYIAPRVVLMPSFVNIGAYVDEGTMIDSWVTVGSCAQIGKDVHISSGAVLGGILEPIQARPVIIEDHCFIGAGSQLLEGCIMRKGAVLGAGASISRSTKIIDRSTGEIFLGEIPPYSVVVPGSVPGAPLPDGSPGPSICCAVITKRVDAQTRQKTSTNELLRT